MKRHPASTSIVIILILASLFSSGHGVFAAERSANQTLENGPWQQLMQRNPYPYTTPIPPDAATAVDGVYAKYETKETPPIACRRCPDYKPEGGWWRVSLRRGVFRIFHPVSGWKSLGTYSLVGDRILLANDPVCPGLTGVYRWKRSNKHLIFATIADKCSAGLRAKNLTHLAWQPCHPHSAEAAVGDDRPEPYGCRQH